MPVRDLRLRIGPAPAWLVFRDSPEAAGARGTVLFWHGFSVHKETHEKELTSLADHGFLAVGIDAVGHGERRFPDFDAVFAGTGPAFLEPLHRVVTASAAEVPAILDALSGVTRPGRIGIAGISMGALIAYEAIPQDRRVGAAVCMLGSTRDLRVRPEDMFPMALLSQCGSADVNVPPDAAREFHSHLEPLYREAPERQRYVEFPGVGHFMPAEVWDRLWGNTVGWLERFVGDASR